MQGGVLGVMLSCSQLKTVVFEHVEARGRLFAR